MFTITIQIPQDALDAGEGSVLPALYGELLVSYTNQSGQTIPINTWVYYTGSDYAPASGVAYVPAYTAYTTTDPQTLTLPDVPIASAHLIFGIGSVPAIPVNSGAPAQPIPVFTPTVYDFVELTYDTSFALYINTTMEDQFGIPIQIQINPVNSNLPQGAGVSLDRADVLSQFQSYVKESNQYFLQCTQDLFGNTLTTRILSPYDAIEGNCVQGVAANVGNAPPSTLAQGTYYYAVTALDNAKNESVAQPNVVLAQTTDPDQAVTIAWSPNTSQPEPAVITSYNVYRGTISETGVITWGLIGNPPATSVGGAFSDTGQTATSQTPPMNPLLTYFDTQIQSFFANYQEPGNQLLLTATDGTSDGYVYSFPGTTLTGPGCLQFLLASVVDPNGNAVSSPPIPLQTPFNVYFPYWNTNTYDVNNPSPPSWAIQYQPYQVPASVMVFGETGVFADQKEQPVPTTVPSTAIQQYQTLLGSLENQIVSALTRGIANLSIAPSNWGSAAPVQTQPVLTSCSSSSLAAGTTYYYVVTAVYENGETVPSLEFNAIPTTTLPCVQVNWEPLNGPMSFNVYRGTVSQQENVLVANVSNSSSTASSYIDSGQTQAQNGPPYVFFPPNVPSDIYTQFFHQPSISLNGAAYASPFDDQGNQSSTLASAAPVSVSITLGGWQS